LPTVTSELLSASKLTRHFVDCSLTQMTNKKYKNAGDAVRALNRFARRMAKPVCKRVRLSPSEGLRDRSLYRDPNILGFGVSPKVAFGKSTPSEPCLVVLIAESSLGRGCAIWFPFPSISCSTRPIFERPQTSMRGEGPCSLMGE
jgi:hypothetical protein